MPEEAPIHPHRGRSFLLERAASNYPAKLARFVLGDGASMGD